jgi:Uma2 family endonuclease
MATVDPHVPDVPLPPPPVVKHPPRIVPTPPPIEVPTFNLPDNDEVPMETPWHRSEMNLLIDSVHWHRRGRTDYYVGGNMFIYYGARQTKTWEYRGPDFFFVDEVDGTRPRRYWMVFEEEGRYPDVIVELSSPSTAEEDRTIKKKIYERTFQTAEYFCYDPDSRQLEGWRLVSKRYQPIAPNERGWLWSEQLGLWLGTWEGTFQNQREVWLRFYDEQGRLVPIGEEAERQRAEAERQRAETERQRAEAERQRAETERQRADAAEAELQRLKALMAEKGLTPPKAD